MSDYKVVMGEADLARYFPADPNGVFVNSNELTGLEIAACRCIPECFHIKDDGWGWGKINKQIAIEKLAIAAYRAYGQTIDFKNFRGDPMPKFEVLPEAIKQAWQASTAAILWQVGY